MVGSMLSVTPAHTHSLIGDGHHVMLVAGEAAAKDGKAVALQRVLERPARTRQVMPQRNQTVVEEAFRVALIDQFSEMQNAM